MEDLKKDQNELNDILIKREGPQGGKLKNVLLMTAALLLIVIIGILTYRIIESNAGDVQREAKEQPAPVAQPDSTLFEGTQPPASSEADAQRQRLDELIARHREAREQEAATQADAQVPPREVAATTPPAPPPPPRQEPKAEPKPEVKPEPKAEPKPEPKVEPAPRAEAAPAPVAKPAATPVASGTFFVQVESLSRDPRDEYLKQLRDSGFNVVVRERSVDGRTIKRVYIGPYGSKEEAAAVLPKIRKDLNPEAFIIQD